MEQSVPLLNPEQLQQLNTMVHSISQDNRKKLQEVLSEQTNMENATILQLYNLVVEEWNKKQNIVDNLCHFALTMTSTVQYLWSQKTDNEQKIGNAQLVIDNLSQQIQELGDQNQNFKRKISEAEFQIEQIVVEKQKIEELYRSQSCINFMNDGEEEFKEDKEERQEKALQRIEPTVKEEEKLICCEHEKQLQEERSHLIEESLKLIDQKENVISSLLKQNTELSKKVQTLTEENQLSRMEVQLAEIAVKDALSYKSNSILNSSMQSDLDSYREQIYTTRSQAQFMNGDLECFSNLDNSYCRTNSLMNQIPDIENFKCQTEPSCPLFKQCSDLSGAQENTEDVTTSESPFKKKMSKISDISDSVVLKDSMLSIPQEDSIVEKKYDNIFSKNKKTVSLQVNLVKDLPKLSFDYKKNLYEEEFKPKIKKVEVSQSKKVKPTHKQKNSKKTNENQKLHSKSEIIKPKKQIVEKPKEYIKGEIKHEEELKTDGSFNKLYSFFSTKLISQRIKVK